jgi:hypothetical protein
LLERHGRLELAAEIADGRKLAADLVVRLRWRAGHRARALEVARARGAYAEAIKRLEPVDPEAAQELRLAWSADLSRAGDYLGAVEAVWPVEELRSTVIPDIQAGMALGGPTAAHLFAYLLATDGRGTGSDAGLALLRTRDPWLLGSRERFITALSRLRCAEPVTDRVLATAAIRELLTHEARPDWHEQALRQAFNALSERADPVLRADLPPLGWHEAGGSSRRALEVVSAAQPGQLPVVDVAALDGGVLLVAHGNHGARLLTLDGKTRASWDIPTHRLVVADHGGIALLANYVGDLTWEFHRLDLLTRRTSRWITIRISHFDPTFDGVTLTVIDEDGALVFLDAQADRPKVLWRELDGVGTAVALARSPGKLAAIVQTRTGPGLPAEHLEQWSWDLPSMTLRGRPPVDWPTSQSTLTSTGVFTSLDVGDQDESAQRWVMRSIERGSRKSPVTLETTGPVRITASGLVHAVIVNEPDVTRVLVTTSTGDDDLTFTFPAGVQPQIRSHGGNVAVWDQAGRIMSVDTIGRRVTCSISTRL